MDPQRLKENIELKLALVEVGLRFKAACRGKQTEDSNAASKKFRALQIDLDLNNFQHNFKIVMAVYGRSVSGFEDGTKMRLFAHPALVESDAAKGQLTKAYEKQKVLLEATTQDCSPSPLWLDTTPEGSALHILREMMLAMKSVKFPCMLLFHLVDCAWNRSRH